MEKRIITIIENYGMLISPEEDVSMAEARNIIHESRTSMEIVGNSYIYGYIRGASSSRKMVPVYNLRQITDAEWCALAEKNKLEREVLV
ncbi:MAG: hypothetical protein HFG66_09290 [Hungatella sp.]|nr:hypothetical protein [Hungatella sp.]